MNFQFTLFSKFESAIDSSENENILENIYEEQLKLDSSGTGGSAWAGFGPAKILFLFNPFAYFDHNDAAKKAHS